MTKKASVPSDESQGQTRFYLIFDEMAKAEAEENVLAAEIAEIEQISRMIQDVTDDEQPHFMTST